MFIFHYRLESQPECPEESQQERLLSNKSYTPSIRTEQLSDVAQATGATVEIAAVKMDTDAKDTAVNMDASTGKNSAENSRVDDEGGLEMKDTTGMLIWMHLIPRNSFFLNILCQLYNNVVFVVTTDRSPALITRPPPATKYIQSFTYHTSVRYDEVPFKEYDKLAGLFLCSNVVLLLSSTQFNGSFHLSDTLSEGTYADFSYLAPEMLLGQYGPQVYSENIFSLMFD